MDILELKEGEKYYLKGRNQEKSRQHIPWEIFLFLNEFFHQAIKLFLLDLFLDFLMTLGKQVHFDNGCQKEVSYEAR